jgi:hypothetical protein
MGIPSRGYLCVGRSAGEAAREDSGFSVNDTVAHCVEHQLLRIVQVELWPRWVSTVKGLMFNSAATSLLLLPSANSRRISRSRVARSSVENHNISG